MLAFALQFRSLGDAICLTSFVCCGIARLARYNSTVSDMEKDSRGKIKVFEGIPAPGNLLQVLVLAFCVYNGSVETHWLWRELPGCLGAKVGSLLFVAMGAGMISKTLHIPKL